jgi:hypothetical protein
VIVDKGGSDMAVAARVGAWAAATVVALEVAYAVVVIAGFAAIPAAGAPIPDPWFTMMESLIFFLVPALVVLMAAVAVTAPPGAQVFGLAALAFMAMLGVVTAMVHALVLILSRDSGLPRDAEALAFVWPSPVYVADVLAWDLFFPLSVLAAAPACASGRLGRWIARLLVTSGVLAAAGLSGALVGEMRLRNVGIVGYVGVFPVAVALMGLRFRRMARPGAVD